MNINKDSLVTSVCGMKSSIKLEKLFNFLEKQDIFCFGDQDRDDVIESLNDGDDGKYIQSDGYYFINSDLEFKICDHGFRNIKAEEIKLFLKDFIGNEYYIMEAIGFEFNTDHTKNLTELAHYQIDSEDIELNEIIKNNTYDQLDKIKEENFLSYQENEKVRNNYGLGGHFEGWRDDLNYWKVYHGWVSYYIIKKGNLKKMNGGRDGIY